MTTAACGCCVLEIAWECDQVCVCYVFRGSACIPGMTGNAIGRGERMLLVKARLHISMAADATIDDLLYRLGARLRTGSQYTDEYASDA